MAWEISITAEGWHDLYTALEAMQSEWLREAIVATEVQLMEEYAPTEEHVYAYEALRSAYWAIAQHDTLVDGAFEYLRTTNTCDNGGYVYWIDPKGYHTVKLIDTFIESDL